VQRKFLESEDLHTTSAKLNSVVEALSVADLRKSFHAPGGETIEVLRGVSFSARLGEAVAITGASGVGKSTLLNLLGGLETTDHGRILLGGSSIEADSPAMAHFRNRRIGFVFQFHHLLPDLTAAENVAMPLMIARCNRRAALTLAGEELTRVGLADRLAYPVGHLSGGEQQRVAVCRALITGPVLVLADEPTGNLDSSIAEEIGDILVSYAHKRSAIVILASHNERLARLCDRLLTLREGRLFDVRSNRGLK
jgi:lipoprotein-releasing system ATP-binding protein